MPICHEPDAEPHTVHLFLGDLPTFAVIAVLKELLTDPTISPDTARWINGILGDFA